MRADSIGRSRVPPLAAAAASPVAFFEEELQMRLRYTIALAAASLLMFAGVPLADTGFSCTIDALQEVPPNASPASGSGFFVLNNAGTALTYSITFQNLTANRIAEHFHSPGLPGVNAGVVRTIAGGGGTSGTDIGVWLSSDAQPLTPTRVAELLAGKMYVNVHTGNFPGGEIRGQILMDATAARATTWGRIKRLYH
jgi:hypothetical protein